MSSEIIWSLENVQAGWNPTEGYLNGISLKIHKGERVALIGYTHSGRHLLLRALAGLRPIRSGALSIFGNHVPHLKYFQEWDHLLPMKVRRDLGISLERDGLLSNVSIREGLELLLRFQSPEQDELTIAEIKENVDVALKRFEIDKVADRRPFQLSAVEKRLSSLARAFLSDPMALILENPTQDLGDFVRNRFWSVLEGLMRNEDRTFVVSTDDFSLAAHFCSRWIVMDEGHVFYDGDVRGFFKTNHSLVEYFRRYVQQQHLKESELLGGLVA